MLVASNEPPVLSALGPYSALCDEHGVDFLFVGQQGLIGVQRKTCADLVASLRDHRMFDLLTKGGLAGTVLLVEGDWEWGRDGMSRRCPGFGWTQYTSVILSVQRKHGVMVITTPTVEATAVLLPQIEHWFEHEDKVSSLLMIPKAAAWGDKRKATALRILQCVPNVSLGMASRFYDVLGLPLALTVDDQAIKDIPGWGPKRVASIRATFNGHPVE